jgi:tetratricopeptide (TPR) repeat protein
VTRARIFISYRRDDAAGEAGRLADHLLKRFGADRLFLDIETIEPGSDFVQVLQRSLKETAAVLVVIGRRWVDIPDAAGRRRLDDPADFVRQEVEAALGRDIPVVPVLVQGARLPRAEDLPAPLVPLVTRQAATLDHDEFHADAERLCDRLAPIFAGGGRWWPLPVPLALTAGVVLVAAMLGGYLWYRGQAAERQRATIEASARQERARQMAALVETASGQQQRGQLSDAVKTLEAARQLDPGALESRLLLEDVAMEWLREVRGDQASGTFGEAIKAPLALVDAALPGSSGSRRADLLAHQGWATFLLWRDGDRSLRPQDRYREALAIDSDNPYANAMLAHWTLWSGDDVDEAARLFGAALRGNRAVEAVRALQWAAYQNESSIRAQVETIRLADAMRRAGQALTPRQSQTMWGIYYFALPSHREAVRLQLLRAVPPDDHLATLRWAFDEFTGGDVPRRQAIRFYSALLDAEAGRQAKARQDLAVLRAELASSPGSLLDAVESAVSRLRAS